MTLSPEHTDIISGLRNGEEKSVKALYAMHYRALCYFADRLISNKAEAEDIAVESFLKLLTKKNDFDNLPDIKSFLFTATRNACIDFLRKTKRRTQDGLALKAFAEPDEWFGENEMIIARILQTVYAEVENLPGQCRRVFKSIFMEGKTTAITAAEMGISPQTVLNQKIKALRMLRVILFKEGLYSAGIFLYVLSLVLFKS